MYIHLFLETFGSCKFCGNKHTKKNESNWKWKEKWRENEEKKYPAIFCLNIKD